MIMRKGKYPLDIAFILFITKTDIVDLVDIEKEGIIMDNLVIGLIVVLALAYIGLKMF